MSKWFEKGCKFSAKKFSWIVGDVKKFREKAEKSVSKEFIDSLNFTGLDVEPYEVLIFSYAGAMVCFILAFILDTLIWHFMVFQLNRRDILRLL